VPSVSSSAVPTPEAWLVISTGAQLWAPGKGECKYARQILFRVYGSFSILCDFKKKYSAGISRSAGVALPGPQDCRRLGEWLACWWEMQRDYWQNTASHAIFAAASVSS